MYSFQPGIVDNSMKRTNRYSRHVTSSKPTRTVSRYCAGDVRTYPPAATITSRPHVDLASNAATAHTQQYYRLDTPAIVIDRPRVDSKWIWQQDPLPKPVKPVSYSNKMKSPYVRKSDHYMDQRSQVHPDYSAEELERIRLKCKAWLESCTPWLPQ